MAKSLEAVVRELCSPRPHELATYPVIMVCRICGFVEGAGHQGGPYPCPVPKLRATLARLDVEVQHG